MAELTNETAEKLAESIVEMTAAIRESDSQLVQITRDMARDIERSQDDIREILEIVASINSNLDKPVT